MLCKYCKAVNCNYKSTLRKAQLSECLIYFIINGYFRNVSAEIVCQEMLWSLRQFTFLLLVAKDPLTFILLLIGLQKKGTGTKQIC